MLQAYLNIIYFGRGAYGISASKAYFDKPRRRLTVAEGALLAALIRRPSTLARRSTPKGAHARWNWVLDGMVGARLSPGDRAAQVFRDFSAARSGRAENQDQETQQADRAKQVTRGCSSCSTSTGQTLNTQGWWCTTAVIPQGPAGGGEGRAAKYLDRQDLRHAAANVVSIRPAQRGRCVLLATMPMARLHQAGLPDWIVV